MSTGVICRPSITDVLRAASVLSERVGNVAAVNCDTGPFPKITLRMTNPRDASRVARLLQLQADSWRVGRITYCLYRGVVDGIEVIVPGEEVRA